MRLSRLHGITTGAYKDTTHGVPPVGEGAGSSAALPEISDAERIELLGCGSFGEVWRVKYLGAEEAWKFIPLERSRWEAVRREVENIRRVSHQNILPCHGFLEAPRTGHFVIRTEYAAGGDLRERVERAGVLTEMETVRIGIQIAAGLAAAHEKGVIHQDLRPKNILTTTGSNGRILLGDFGISASIKDRSAAAGSRFFMSPDQVDGKPPAPTHDVWSLGITLLFLMTGHVPFHHGGGNPVMDLHRDRIRVEKYAPMVSPGFVELLEMILTVDHGRRIGTVREVASALERVENALLGNARMLEARSLFSRGDYEKAAALLHHEHAEPTPEHAGLQRLEQLAIVRRENLAGALVAIEENIGRNLLGVALKIFWRAMEYHPGSAALMKLRDRLFDRITQSWDVWESRIQSYLQSGDFAGAENLLKDADLYLQDRGLVCRLSGRHVAPEKDRRHLLKRTAYYRHMVRKTWADYQRLAGAFEASLGSLVMKRCVELAHQMTVRFPESKLWEERLGMVRQANDLLLDLDARLPEKLKKIIPGIIESGTRLMPVEALARIRDASEILGRLTGDGECLEALEHQLCRELAHLNERLEECLAAVDGLVMQKKPGEALDVLRPVRSLVERSDIVDGDRCRRITDLIKKLEDRAVRVERLSSAGREALKLKEYQRACEHFQACQAMMPTPEIAKLLEKAEAGRQAHRGNREALDELLGRFSSAASVVTGPRDWQMLEEMHQHLVEIFRLVGKWSKWEDTDRRQDILQAVVRYLVLCNAAMAVRSKTAFVIELLGGVADLFEAAPDNLVPASPSSQEKELASEINRGVEGMLTSVAATIGGEENPEEELQAFESVVGNAGRLQSLLVRLPLGLGQNPPLLPLPRAIDGFLQRRAGNILSPIELRRIRRILRQFESLGGDVRVRFAASETEKLCTRGLRRIRVNRTMRRVAVGFSVVMVAVALVLGGTFYGRWDYHPKWGWDGHLRKLMQQLEQTEIPMPEQIPALVDTAESYGRTVGLMSRLYRTNRVEPPLGTQARLHYLDAMVAAMKVEIEWQLKRGVKDDTPEVRWLRHHEHRLSRSFEKAWARWMKVLLKEVAAKIQDRNALADIHAELRAARSAVGTMAGAMTAMNIDAVHASMLDDLVHRTRPGGDTDELESWIMAGGNCDDDLTRAVRIAATCHCLANRKAEFEDSDIGDKDEKSWERAVRGLFARLIKMETKGGR